MLEKRPDDPALLNALGYTLADHSLELPHAETLIRRALTVMPDSPAALDSLGWVRFRNGDVKGAVGDAASAPTRSATTREIAAHWGEALWVSGNQAEARRVWAAALARDPDSKPLKATLKRFLPDARSRSLAGRRCGLTARDARRLSHAAAAGVAGLRRLGAAPAAAAGAGALRLQGPRGAWPPARRLQREPALDAEWHAARSSPLDGPLGVGGVQITANGDDAGHRQLARRAHRRVPRRTRSSRSAPGIRFAAAEPALLDSRRARPGATGARKSLDPAQQRLAALTQDGWHIAYAPVHRRARRDAARAAHARARHACVCGCSWTTGSCERAGGGAPER